MGRRRRISMEKKGIRRYKEEMFKEAGWGDEEEYLWKRKV